MNDNEPTSSRKPSRRPPWNKGKLVGPKPPLRQGHVWSIRTKLQIEGRARDLALFNLAIDSKLRGCDVVAVPSRTVTQRRVDRRYSLHKTHSRPRDASLKASVAYPTQILDLVGPVPSRIRLARDTGFGENLSASRTSAIFA